MSNNNKDIENENAKYVADQSSKLSLLQLQTLVSYIEQHPELAWDELRKEDMKFDKKCLWNHLSKTLNTIEGSHKTRNGWIRYWQNRRRLVTVRSRQIKHGKIKKQLSPIEHRIMKILKYNRIIKDETSNNDNSEKDNAKANDVQSPNEMISNDLEEKNHDLMDMMVEVMGKQALSLSRIAKESLKKSKAMTQIAEASYRQALAIDNLATVFNGFSGSLCEVRNAITSLVYTMKRCYPPDSRNRDNSNNILYR